MRFLSGSWRQRSLVTWGLILFLAAVLSGCSAASTVANVETGSRKVAVFDGGQITQSEVQKQIDALARQSGLKEAPKPGSAQYKAAVSQVMPQLVDTKIAEAYAREHGISVSSGEVQKALENFKKQAGQQARQQFGTNLSDEEAFRQVLKGYGINESQARQQIRVGLLVRKVEDRVTGSVSPSEKQIKSYYEKNKAQFKVPERRCFSAIVFAPDKAKQKKQAEKVKGELENGGDFAKLAKKYSQDPRSAKKGGKVGCVSKGQISLSALDKAIFSAKKGNVSGPIEVKNLGYYLIEVTKIEPGHTTPLEKVAPQIKQHLAQQERARAFQKWLEQQKKSRDVKYLPAYRPQGSTS